MNPYESPQPDPALKLQASDIDRPIGERLGLEHLVLYAAGVAVAAWLNPLVADAIGNLQLTRLFSRFALQPLLHGAGLGAIGLLVLRRYQGRLSFPTQAGHWLLLTQAASYCAEKGVVILMRQLLFRRAYYPSFLDPMIAVPLAELLLWMAVAVVALLALYYLKGQPEWQFYFLLLAVNSAWLAVFDFFGRDENRIWFFGAFAGGLMAVLLFFLVAIKDLKQRQGKDQIHWTGVAFQLAVTVFWRLILWF